MESGGSKGSPGTHCGGEKTIATEWLALQRCSERPLHHGRNEKLERRHAGSYPGGDSCTRAGDPGQGRCGEAFTLVRPRRPRFDDDVTLHRIDGRRKAGLPSREMMSTPSPTDLDNWHSISALKTVEQSRPGASQPPTWQPAECDLFHGPGIFRMSGMLGGWYGA